METALSAPAPTAEEIPDPAPAHEKIRLWDRLNLFLGQSALAQVVLVEAVGATNDASWINHHGGVTPWQESTGMPADLALWTVLPRQSHEQHDAKGWKAAVSKLGEGVMLAALGYGAQKLGVDVMEHVHSGFNSGAGEYIVPAVSKIGTLTAAKNGSRVLRETMAASDSRVAASPTLAHA